MFCFTSKYALTLYEMIQKRGVLVKDPEPAYYLYRMRFTDEAQRELSACAVPGDATTIAPPQAEPGYVPAFDTQARCWHLRVRPAAAGMHTDGRLDGDTPEGSR